jgi:UDP-N-acetylmuramoylalanine--D-glutamate ligase
MKYVIGLSKTGVSVISYFLKHQIPFVAWDDSPVLQEKAQLMGAKVIEPHKAPWHEIQQLILSPGIPTTFPKPHAAVELARKYHVPMIGDVEFGYQRLQHYGYRFVGVTGTNGKSTTHAIIDYILNATQQPHFSCGNSGVPILEAPELPAGGVFNLEMSSYQLETLDKMTFDAGVILNITPDHLDRHGDMEHYIKAKQTQIQRVKPGGLKVVGVDTPYSEQAFDELLEAGHEDIIQISTQRALDKGVYTVDNLVYSSESGTHVLLGNIPDNLPGDHNAENVMAAMLVCRHVGVDPHGFFKVLPQYPGLAHRQERVLDTSTALFINDSKATNAEATLPALKTYDNIYWIVGGIAKEEGLVPLLPYLDTVSKVFLIGESVPRFMEELKVANKEILVAHTLEKAIEMMADDIKTAREKVTVLLSPACASQDQFQNFEHRGNVFKDLVQQQFGA